MPERLEDRALPGGSLLGLLFGVPLAEPFLGSVWADGNPLGSDDLPGVNARRREHLAALEGLQRDRLLADELFGEVRRLVQIAGASTATADAYVDVARTRLLGVAGSLAASDAAVLASHDFLADLWWTDELLTSLARGRALGAPRFLAELPVEGDDPEGMTMLGYGGYGNMPPVANDDSYYTKHDTNLSVSPPGVMSNDYDPNGDPLTASLVSGPSHAASFNFNSNGSFSYTPAYHYVGADSFVYRVSDGQYTDDATVSLSVNNSAPVANNDSYQTKHDVALNVSAPGVKSNDYDYDYDPITAILVTGPSHASSFTLNSNGSFSYTPAYHYVGVDTFTYKVNDGIVDSNTATVSINVYNNAPVANNDSYQTKHDVTLNVSAPGVKSNDYDSDGDPMTAILVSGPSHASSFTFNYNGNGSFTYTPAYHYVGVDTFTYKVNDGIVDSNTATVSINVYNNAPVAVNDGPYTTLRDIPLHVSAPGPLGNDTDPDGDQPLEAGWWANPVHGSLDLRVNGEFTYTPSGGYVGTDSFQYKAFDGIAYSIQPGTVSLAVAGLKVRSVDFLGDTPVYRDPDQSNPYPSPYPDPLWLDANGDGDATDPGDNLGPVCYVRAETMHVTTTFTLDRSWTNGGTIMISAVSNDGINIPWTAATVNGTTVTITDAAASTAFPNVVKHYDDLVLYWYATVLGQTATTLVGTTSNDVYLTYAQPASTLYHTVLHLGSHYAQGADNETDVILGVWNNVLHYNSVQRVDGIPLWYYHNYGIQILGHWDTRTLLIPLSTSDGTLGDGNCVAWRALMLDVVGAQGIARANSRVDVRPANASEGFLVEFWQFGGAHSDQAIESIPGENRDQLVATYPSLNVLQAGGGFFNAAGNGYEFRFADVSDSPGTQGKGPNNNPASVFGAHMFTQFTIGTTTIWFDPSYGCCYSGASEEARELDLDDGSVAGYFLPVTANVRESVIQVDLNGDTDTNDVVSSPVFLIRTNVIGTREMDATVS